MQLESQKFISDLCIVLMHTGFARDCFGNEIHNFPSLPIFVFRKLFLDNGLFSGSAGITTVNARTTAFTGMRVVCALVIGLLYRRVLHSIRLNIIV